VSSLWATFSVLDHVRPRSFVADVLLYDLLVIPVPDDEHEVQRWRDRGCEPDRQVALLAILEDLALPVPWSQERADRWAQRYLDAGSFDAAAVGAAVRDDIARDVAFDAGNIADARKTAAGTPAARRPSGLDDPGLMMTRVVLADELDERKDRALLAGIPSVDDVETVVAYGSYQDFRDDRGSVLEGTASERQAVFILGSSFFVPEDSRRSDEDLLREAVELAHTQEILQWRAAVQRWRRNSVLMGRSDAEALREMESLIEEYREAARKRNIGLSTRWGFAIAAAAAAAAAAFVPLVGVPAGAFALGSLLAPHEIPKRLDAAAMFYEARRRFS
jgi:hypothetical protein